MKPITLLLTFLIFVGCTPQKNNKNHPNPENLPPANEVDFTIKLGSDISSKIIDTDKLELVSKISSDTTLDEELYLYDVNNVYIDKRNMVYFTKADQNFIFVYDINGDYKYKIGGPGYGPGEFLEIRSFDFNVNESLLYILDRNELEIFRFERSQSQFIPLKTIIHNLNMVSDLCLLNSKLFVNGFTYEEVDSTNKKKQDSMLKLQIPYMNSILSLNRQLIRLARYLNLILVLQL